VHVDVVGEVGGVLLGKLILPSLFLIFTMRPFESRPTGASSMAVTTFLQLTLLKRITSWRSSSSPEQLVGQVVAVGVAEHAAFVEVMHLPADAVQALRILLCVWMHLGHG
jgi:hypothetical protein